MLTRPNMMENPCDTEACSKCGGKCTQIVDIGPDGKETFKTICLRWSDSKDLTACHNFAVQLGKVPSQPARPQRPQRQLQGRGRPMYHAARTVRATNPSHGGRPTGMHIAQDPALGGNDIDHSKYVQCMLDCWGSITAPGVLDSEQAWAKFRACRAKCLQISTKPKPPQPAGVPTLTAAPPMPAAVRRRLERKGRERIAAQQAAGPGEQPTSCKEHCDKYYIWPFWEDCMKRCKAKGWFGEKPDKPEPARPGGTVSARPRPQSAPQPCPPGQVRCPPPSTMGCVDNVADCGLTTPPPRPPAPAGVRRAQAAMAGRLNNPRYGC